VGSHIALILAQRGEDSILFDLSDPPSTITNADSTLRSKIKFERGDVADLGAIMKAAKDNQVEGIINSARLLTGVRECFRANAEGALNTMEVARSPQFTETQETVLLIQKILLDMGVLEFMAVLSIWES